MYLPSLNFETLANYRHLDVFRPLFEVTQNPQTHPELHVFLQRVVGFDTVDDESKVERRIHKKFPYPRLWDLPQSPPYSYWVYYMYANMASLNNWRRLRGFSAFLGSFSHALLNTKDWLSSRHLRVTASLR